MLVMPNLQAIQDLQDTEVCKQLGPLCQQCNIVLMLISRKNRCADASMCDLSWNVTGAQRRSGSVPAVHPEPAGFHLHGQADVREKTGRLSFVSIRAVTFSLCLHRRTLCSRCWGSVMLM